MAKRTQQNTTQNIMTDPLNLDIELQDVDSDLPLLPEGEYDFQVVSSTVEPNKDRSGRNWVLKFGLAAPATAVDGRQIKPNFPVFQQCALQAKEDSTDPDAFKRNLAEAIDGIFKTAKGSRPPLSQAVQTAVGQIVKLHIVIDEYKGKKNNKVKRFVKPGA